MKGSISLTGFCSLKRLIGQKVTELNLIKLLQVICIICFCSGNMREKTEVVFRGKWANYMHDYNVNKIREMVSFELGKEIEKDDFRRVSSVEQRKHSESPEESNVRLSDSALRCSSTEPQSLYVDRGL